MQLRFSDNPTNNDGPLVLVPQYFGSVVFDRRTSRYMPFDVETTNVLKQLKSEPLDCLLERMDSADEREKLTSFFEHFYKLGFFTVDRKFAGVVRNVMVPSDHLVGPLALHLEVVASCNLKCTHCFAGDLPRRDLPLTLEELDTLFATLARIGTFRIGLTGGEPLLKPDLFQIIDLATKHGLCPCLTTNGLLITEEVAQEFGRRKLAWLNVSLEGATAATNDKVRGCGTFDKVVQNLSLLAKHTQFTMAFTIMKSNLHEIKACAELAARVGAHTAVFRPLYPVGIAVHHLELMPSFSDYNQALNALLEAGHENDFGVCSIDPFGPQTREPAQSVIHKNYGCGAGNLVCSISISGDVNPCSFLGPEFAAGNIRERSFEEIWHNSHGFRQIRSLPSDTLENGKAAFSGGCRARAQFFNGSINAPDPWITSQTEALTAAHHPLTIVEISGLHKKTG